MGLRTEAVSTARGGEGVAGLEALGAIDAAAARRRRAVGAGVYAYRKYGAVCARHANTPPLPVTADKVAGSACAACHRALGQRRDVAALSYDGRGASIGHLDRRCANAAETTRQNVRDSTFDSVVIPHRMGAIAVQLSAYDGAPGLRSVVR